MRFDSQTPLTPPTQRAWSRQKRPPGVNVFRRAIVILFALLVAMDSSADPGDLRPELDLSVGLYSDYISRGRLRDSGPSLQPSFSLGAELGDETFLSAGAWSHVPIGNSRISKLESIIRLDHTIAGITGSIGHTLHTFIKNAPSVGNDEDDSAEIFAALVFDTTFSPQLTLHYDYDRFDSLFIEFLLSHRMEYDWRGEFAIVPNITIGALADDDERYEKTGWTFVSYGFYAEVPIQQFVLIPSVHFNQKIDDATTNRWLAGIACLFSF